MFYMFDISRVTQTVISGSVPANLRTFIKPHEINNKACYYTFKIGHRAGVFPRIGHRVGVFPSKARDETGEAMVPQGLGFLLMIFSFE